MIHYERWPVLLRAIDLVYSYNKRHGGDVHVEEVLHSMDEDGRMYEDWRLNPYDKAYESSSYEQDLYELRAAQAVVWDEETRDYKITRKGWGFCNQFEKE